MPVAGGVFFEDSQEPRSPLGQYANDNGRTTRTLHMRPPAIDQADEVERFQARKALLGFATVNQGDGKVWINRSTPSAPPQTGGALPASYPAVIDFDLNPTGQAYQWCTNIPSERPLGVASGVVADGTAVYAGSRVEAQHNTLAWQIVPDAAVIAASGPLAGKPDEGAALASGWFNTRFIARYFKPGSRIITLPNGFMQNSRIAITTGKPAAIPQGIAVRQSYGNLKYVWMQVPLGNPTPGGFRLGAPQAAWGACYNHCNNATFDGFPGGTLLLKDVELKQYQSGLGQWLMDVAYTMEYLPNYDIPSATYRGHNSIIQIEQVTPKDPTTARIRFDYMTTDGAAPSDGNVAFPANADFGSLFRPDQV